MLGSLRGTIIAKAMGMGPHLYAMKLNICTGWEHFAATLDAKRRIMYQNQPFKMHQLPFDQVAKKLFLQYLQRKCTRQNQLEHHMMVFCIDPNDLALLFITSVPI